MGPDIDGPLYRTMWNMMPRFGQLCPRPAVQDEAAGLSSDGDPYYSIAAGDSVWPLPSGEAGTGDEVHVLHASKIGDHVFWSTQFDMYWDQVNISAFFDYSTGTLSSVSTGSAVITGSGTSWLSAPWATKGSRMEIKDSGGNPVWYSIASVDSDTQITLTTTYEAASYQTGYRIRPTLHTGTSSDKCFALSQRIFSTVFNGDLYVAAAIGKFDSSYSSSLKDAIVFRIVDAERSAPSSTDLEVLYGGLADYDPSGTAEFASYLIDLKGMDLLQDGRIVLACHYWTTTSGGSSRILYSSHLDVTKWNNTPGGFVDVVGAGQGPLQAMGRLDQDLTLHYRDGVVLASQTGNANSPLTFRRTRAKHGCCSARGIVSLGQAEMYIAADGALHVFSGAESQEISDATIRALTLLTEEDFVRSWVWWDDHLENFWLFTDVPLVLTPANQRWQSVARPGSRTNMPNYTDETMALCVHMTSGAVSLHMFPCPVYDAVRSRTRTKDNTMVLACIMQQPSLLSNVGPVALSWSSSADQANAVVGDQLPYWVESDDLDFGAPGVKKCVLQATLKYGDFSVSSGHDLSVAISYDSGNTWDERTQTLVSVGGSVTGENEAHTFFVFDPGLSGEKVRFRIRSMQGITLGPEAWGATGMEFYLTGIELHVNFMSPVESL